MSMRSPARRGVLASLAAGLGAVAVVALGRLRPLAGHARGYQITARWAIPGGEGEFVALAPESGDTELRIVGERLVTEFRDVASAVVMIFDDATAARTMRRGSRNVDERDFQAALRHQRAMYVKQAARGEHRLVTYDVYPRIRDEIRY